MKAGEPHYRAEDGEEPGISENLIFEKLMFFVFHIVDPKSKEKNTWCSPLGSLWEPLIAYS